MPAMRSALLLALLATACAAAPPKAAPAAPMPAAVPVSSAPPAAPVPVTTTADTPASSGGATFTVPSGWTLLAETGRARLTGPETDLRLAIVDVSGGSADDAVATGWRVLHPDFKRPLKLAQPRPGRHGWDERRTYTYETSPNEKLVVFAHALRLGAAWTVLLCEAAEGTFEKRAAAVSRVAGSLRPKGYERESFVGRKPHALDAARIAQITASVERARDQAGIPGIALALIQDGRTVYEGGLGVRELGKPAKIDAHTMFMIASNTKALTTLLLAKLVDEGKITWDTPATSIYPSFKLGDADTTRQVLVRHLVCACTGLPRQDLEWLFEYEKQTPKSELDLLGTMQPTTKFGETFQYSNPLAAAAGYLAGHVVYPKKELGAAYDEAMQTRVFGPLGMTETTFDFDRALRSGHAAAHGLDVDGKPALAPMELNRSVVSLRPAGAAWSTVHDMAKYVTMELSGGKLAGNKRYVSEEALLARRKPQVSIGEYASYGMGLMVDTEWGVPVVHHGGDMIGFHSDMFWVPDAGVGGVILTNGTGYLVRRAFLRKTLEVLFDGLVEADEDVGAVIAQHMAGIAAERHRLTVPPDPTLVAKLARRYTNAALGDVKVDTGAVGTVFDFGGWKSPVATRKNDDGTVSLVTIAPDVEGIPFVVGERAGKRTLTLRDAQHEYELVEVK